VCVRACVCGCVHVGVATEAASGSPCGCVCLCVCVWVSICMGECVCVWLLRALSGSHACVRVCLWERVLYRALQSKEQTWLGSVVSKSVHVVCSRLGTCVGFSYGCVVSESVESRCAVLWFDWSLSSWGWVVIIRVCFLFVINKFQRIFSVRHRIFNRVSSICKMLQLVTHN